MILVETLPLMTSYPFMTSFFPPFYASLLAYVTSFENGLNDPADPKALISMDDNGRSTSGIHLEMYRKFTSSLLEIKKRLGLHRKLRYQTRTTAFCTRWFNKCDFFYLSV